MDEMGFEDLGLGFFFLFLQLAGLVGWVTWVGFCGQGLLFFCYWARVALCLVFFG
jgi:hypothetical protein